jgi:hypothetical protein
LLGLLGCWNLGWILITGTTSYRTGVRYRRSKEPVAFWACACALVLPLGASAFLLTDTFGASTLAVFAACIVAMAGALTVVGWKVR